MCAFSEETGAVPLCFHKITRFYFPWLQYYLSSSLKETSITSQYFVSPGGESFASNSLLGFWAWFRGSELYILTAALGNIFCLAHDSD